MADNMPFELLAPAGNWDCARAAVENGADAIYFGLESGFNARARAANFSTADLPRLLEFLHLRGVRGYVTLNTLVFSDEIDSFLRHAVAVARAGVDAVLVQDLGIARLLRETCPDLELHASTQMTLSSSEGMQLAERLGLTRAVLPRELSIKEIGTLAEITSLGLEAFVHGALCVAYSGQCLTSESLGGRSANRGQCAQACRLPYEVICDGEDVELDKVKYLLSPQDLAAHALLPDMVRAGVRSFKIEGRLKTPEYVANVTRRYREALDAAIDGLDFQLDDTAVEELELSFSRGFSPGWLQGCDHKMLVPGESSAKRGVHVGKVVSVRSNWVTVELERHVAAGDGVVFDGDRLSGSEQGGRILNVARSGKRLEAPVDAGTVELQLRREDIDFDEIYEGQSLWKTDDPKLTRRLRSTFSGPDPVRKTWLDVKVTSIAGKPLQLTATAESGAHCSIQSQDALPVARKHAVTDEILREQFSRLGGTVYQLRNLEATIEGNPMAPLSILGASRKEMIAALNASIAAPAEIRVDKTAIQRIRNFRQAGAGENATASPSLYVMCRKLYQLESILSMAESLAGIYVDFQDIREYRAAVELCREYGALLYLATPRIEKPGETGIFKLIEKLNPDGVLVRNLGGLHYFRERQFACVADFSLNAANEISVDVLCDWGSQRVTTSYDLNRDQMLAMVKSAQSPSRMEVVIHQHMPMFHMEHCVFCAVLSPGTNKHNCGRPCDDHSVQLRDRVGMEHPLHADVGCRNTLYNATPQSSAEIASTLIRSGIQHFRVELLEDSKKQCREVVTTYLRLLEGKVTGQEVWKRLNANNQVGVTRGTLEAKRDPLALL